MTIMIDVATRDLNPGPLTVRLPPRGRHRTSAPAALKLAPIAAPGATVRRRDPRAARHPRHGLVADRAGHVLHRVVFADEPSSTLERWDADAKVAEAVTRVAGRSTELPRAALAVSPRDVVHSSGPPWRLVVLEAISTKETPDEDPR